MICSVCGKPQPCVHSPVSSRAALEDPAGNAELARVEAQICPRQPAAASFSLDDLAAQVRAQSDQRTWREEVALRVDRHRAKRRRSDESESLTLDFPAEEALTVSSTAVQHRYEALASGSPATLISTRSSVQGRSSQSEDDGGFAIQKEPAIGETVVRPRPRKVIRFPKYSAPPDEPLRAPLITEIELPEPVPEVPRIMEAAAAEQLELLPSFADIRLEELPREDISESLELPLRTASLGRRLFSALLDAGIVVSSVAIFIFSFVGIVPNPVPARAELLGVMAAGVILWLLFQYLFLVYSWSTPGMRAARLQLFAFDGRRAPLRARRARALASAISVFSVGLGYAWALVDEESLGWHDRISQTYLKIG